MRKSDLVRNIVRKTGVNGGDVSIVVEAFMSEIKESMCEGKNVYLRGFGSFVVKERARKIGRDIKRNISIDIPVHNIPSFKPARLFKDGVKKGTSKE